MPPTYFIKTYGCQMNVADSAKLVGVLESAGYQAVNDAEKADIVLVVTCVVRQHAEDRALGFIRSLTGAKERNPDLIIAVCGCLVTEPGRDVGKQFPHVDWFIPPNSPGKLAELLSARSPFPVPRSPFVTIMHGCDNYCSYCVVPYVRGREFSRPMDDVLAEIKGLIGQGVTDITLLGQNVNSYKHGLADLLWQIKTLIPLPPVPSEVEGLGEGGGLNAGRVRAGVIIRFMTSHPRDMSDEIIEAVAELPYVAKEFHLPLQSGDDEVLKRMNRGYTVGYFRDRVARIRSLIPHARITTDMMVGFPGETEEQFQNTLTLIEDLRFAAVNMFAYSIRPMTAAAKLPDQLPEAVKQARLQKLIEAVRAVVKASAA